MRFEPAIPANEFRDPLLKPRAFWYRRYAIASVYFATPHCDCADSTRNVCCMCN